MKICFIAWTNFGVGGIPKVLTNTLNFLSLSHTIHVYCLKSAPIIDAYKLNRDAIKFNHREMSLFEKIRRSCADLIAMHTRLFTTDWGVRLYPLIRYSKKFRYELSDYINLHDFDIVVYSTGLHEALLLTSIKTHINKRVKLVAWSHLSYELTFANRFIAAQLNQAIKKIFPSLDAIIVLSDHDEEIFKKNHGLKTTRIYNSVSFTPSTVKYKEKNSFVYVGSLSYDKGIDIAVEAFAKLYKQKSDCTLHVYGTGPLTNHVSNLIKKQSLSKCVFLHGNHLNMEQELPKYEVFLFPSRYEGFGIAQVEAMASGLTIIASDVPVNVELSKKSKSSLLFKSGDINSLYNVMKKIHNSNRFEYSVTGVKFAKQFSIEKIGNEWNALFRTLLS